VEDVGAFFWSFLGRMSRPYSGSKKGQRKSQYVKELRLPIAIGTGYINSLFRLRRTVMIIVTASTESFSDKDEAPACIPNVRHCKHRQINARGEQVFFPPPYYLKYFFL
jgi:hypothetical protein